MRVEPASLHPPASSRTLAEWLDLELARMHGDQSRTRLREIADARAARRGMWAAFLALGASSAVLGTVMLAIGAGPRDTLPWVIGGLVVIAVAGAFLQRERRRIPRVGETYSTRGAGSFVGGLLAALGLFAAVNVFFIPAMLSSADPVPLLVIDLGLACLLTSGFVVPAAILGRGRVALRRQAQRDPRLAAALEHERTTWVPRAAVPMFGPL